MGDGETTQQQQQAAGEAREHQQPEEGAEAGPAKADPADAKTSQQQPVAANSSNTDGTQQTRTVLKPYLDPNPREVRKSSVVSFQQKCELHEIDLENGRDKKKNDHEHGKPDAIFSLRYYVMLLALVSPFVVTYSKTIINFAIIDMIHPDSRGSGQAGGSSLEQQQLQGATSVADNGTLGPGAYFDLDNSCPVSDDQRERLTKDLDEDEKRSGERFEWDTVRQGLLKAAYPIGHALCSIIGGRLSEIFGSHWIMGLSSLLIGVCCLMAPLLAFIHFYLMFADLVILGILGSFMTPALITLFTNWLTPSEKSMMISFYLVSSRLGFALSSSLCGLLIEAQLSWRYIFYSAGWISFIFSALFLTCSRSRPQDHPFISQKELHYLAQKNTLVREGLSRKRAELANNKVESVEMKTNNTSDNSQDDTIGEPGQKTTLVNKTGAPWLAILTNVPVWAFVVTKFCVKLAGDTVQTELPTYLNNVMHFTPRDNGFVNASNYVIFCFSCLLVGGLAKMANKRRPFGWSKTAVRKLFQSTASFGVAIILLGLSFSVCKNTLTQIFLILMFFFTTFGTGGEAQIPLDISERYAGTIHAIGSSLAISGAIEPIMVGFLLRNKKADQNRWALVWMGASVIAAFGGVVFLVFGDASIQSFDSIQTKQQDTDEKHEERRSSFSGSDNKAFENDSDKPNEQVQVTDNDGETNEMSLRESAQI